MKVSDFLDLDVIHQAFSLRKENPKDDTFRSAQGGKRPEPDICEDFDPFFPFVNGKHTG